MVQVLSDLHILGAGAETAKEIAWIKVLSFRAADGTNLRKVEQQVKSIQKRMRAKVRDERELLDVVAQAPLQISSKPVRLQDLEMRPSFSGRKTVGTCEIHRNGIRFRSNRGEKVGECTTHTKQTASLLFVPRSLSLSLSLSFRSALSLSLFFSSLFSVFSSRLGITKSQAQGALSLSLTSL